MILRSMILSSPGEESKNRIIGLSEPSREPDLCEQVKTIAEQDSRIQGFTECLVKRKCGALSWHK